MFPVPEADRPGSRIEGRHERPNIPPAAELRHEPTARLECPPHAGDGFFRRLHPVEHGVGEHGVEGLVERELARIRDFEAEIRVDAAGLLDHPGGGVDTDDFDAGLRDLSGQMAGAAAEVEDPLALARREEIDQRGPVLPDERVLVVVEAGVPVGYVGCVHWNKHVKL